MRVRSFQTFLVQQRLINRGSLADLRGLRVGFDAVIWLRSLPNLKDPLADAIGGPPAMLPGILDATLERLRDVYGLDPVFVFQGLQPRLHSLFNGQLHQQMLLAWRQVTRGEYLQAQHLFAQATSRINSDFIYQVSHHLRRRGAEVMQAPYNAGSQLAYFAQEGVVDAVFGPPALLLLGLPRVIINIDLKTGEYDWVDREQILSAWDLTEAQFVDACILAGTEYCLTYPYLNFAHFHQHQGRLEIVSGSQFMAAIEFAKQAPLAGFVCHFLVEKFRDEHVQGYAFCKCLLSFPLALHFDGRVAPLVRAHPLTEPPLEKNIAKKFALKNGLPEDAGVDEKSEEALEKRKKKKSARATAAGAAADVPAVSSGAAAAAGPVSATSAAPAAASAGANDAAAVKNGKEEAGAPGAPVAGGPAAAGEKASASGQQAATGKGDAAATSPADGLADGGSNGNAVPPSTGSTVARSQCLELPRDFDSKFGMRLPPVIFLLMAKSIIGRKLPMVLALGEWSDMSHPTADSVEYRDLLTEVQVYRARAVGLVMQRLHKSLHRDKIRFVRFNCAPLGSITGIEAKSLGEAAPDLTPPMQWTITTESLAREMKRQRATKIDYRFCLEWHSNEVSQGRNLCRPGVAGGGAAGSDSAAAATGLTGLGSLSSAAPPTSAGPQTPGSSPLELIAAHTYFSVLECLGYFTPEGGVTVFGSALCGSGATGPGPLFSSEILFALELMKSGALMGEALEAPSDRPFPENAIFVNDLRNSAYQAQILLLSRVVSIVPMRLLTRDLWLAPVDFDLAAYHCIVKLLKKTFRTVTEACLLNLLLQDPGLIQYVSPLALDPLAETFPTFALPRNCLGIIMKHFLEFEQVCEKDAFARNARTGARPPPLQSLRARDRLAFFSSEMVRYYMCCQDPVRDLVRGIEFWCALTDIIDTLAVNIDVTVLRDDMQAAQDLLLRAIVNVALYLHPAFAASPLLERLRTSIAPLVAEAEARDAAAAAAGSAVVSGAPPTAAVPAAVAPAAAVGTAAASGMSAPPAAAPQGLAAA